MLDQREIVLNQVSKDYKVSIDEIKGKCRNSELVDVRCVVVIVLFRLGYSKSSIARFLGNRHHTTIMNIIERGRKRIDIQWAGEKYVEIFKKKLRNSLIK